MGDVDQLGVEPPDTCDVVVGGVAELALGLHDLSPAGRGPNLGVRGVERLLCCRQGVTNEDLEGGCRDVRRTRRLRTEIVRRGRQGRDRVEDVLQLLGLHFASRHRPRQPRGADGRDERRRLGRPVVNDVLDARYEKRTRVGGARIRTLDVAIVELVARLPELLEGQPEVRVEIVDPRVHSDDGPEAFDLGTDGLVPGREVRVGRISQLGGMVGWPATVLAPLRNDRRGSPFRAFTRPAVRT